MFRLFFLIGSVNLQSYLYDLFHFSAVAMGEIDGVEYDGADVVVVVERHFQE